MHSDGGGRGLAALNRYEPGLRLVPRIGDFDASVDVEGRARAAGFDSKYASELQGYATRGGGLPADVIAKAKSLYEAAVDYVNKGEAVAEDVSLGATIGAMIPVLGEIGIGEIAGAIVGAIYGVLDNFGDDIHDLFNPPDFKQSDYDRMQQAQLASGAIPVYGVPPDQYGACIYPDGARSGGDFPYPGSWNGEIRDQAAYDRAKARDAAAQYALTLCGGQPCKALVPISVQARSRVLAILSNRSLSTALKNQKFKSLLLADIARREQFTKSIDMLRTNVVVRNRLLTALGIPTPPAPAATKAAAPTKPTTKESVKASAPPSGASPVMIVGAGIGASALALGAVWWFTQRKGR